MSGEWQVEMLWRCAACDHRNLGRDVACQGCGKPKTGAEEYEMPSDTSEASAVRAPELLRVATGGANWRCRFCASDQRRADGACAQCGAPQGDEPPARVAVAPPDEPLAPRARSMMPAVAVLAAMLGALVLWGLASTSSSSSPHYASAVVAPVSHDVVARVAAVAWEHAVQVERYRLVDREGFADLKPADAVDPHAAGKRVHHTDKVPDGTATESYTETVPDGTRTESYTEQERCGETCTARPQRCSRKCTPNKNGFATCRDECTGGGQDCSPRYCSVQKTRQVPQTKTVQRTRQVPRFRDEPRYADWYTWKAWDWTNDRVVREHGETPETRWPAPEAVHLGVGLAKGEQERARQEPTYRVHLRGDDGQSYEVRPQTVDELQRFGLATRHRLRVGPGGGIEAVTDDPDDAAAPAPSATAP